MSCYQMETGYQLFARLNTRPTLENIYPNLFTNFGPKGREVIEILGDTSTGKTFLITEFIANCILPVDIIGGKNAGAIIINTDNHFHIFKLVHIMESILKKSENLTSSQIQDSIQSSLKNLIILNCFDSQQLFVTVHNLENIISNHNRVALVVLDSISSYYWCDRANNGIKSMDLYQRTILKLIQNKTKEFNINIMFSKSSGFLSKKEIVEECCKTPTLEKINYKIVLEKISEDNLFNAQITLPDNTKFCRKYRIRDLIEWEDI